MGSFAPPVLRGRAVLQCDWGAAGQPIMPQDVRDGCAWPDGGPSTGASACASWRAWVLLAAAERLAAGGAGRTDGDDAAHELEDRQGDTGPYDAPK
jgi:hypothetical protein